MKQRKITIISILFIALLLTACAKENKDGNLSLGMQAIEELNYSGALEFFAKAKEVGEEERLVARGMGIAHMGLTQYEEAVACFEEALSYSNGRVDDIDYDINYYMAVSYYKLGDLQEAINSYTAILNLRPKEKNSYLFRGIAELENDQYDAAIADFDKAISLDKTDYDLLIQIYLNLEKNGYKEAGQEYLNQALSQENASMTDVQAGKIYYYLADYENARNSLEKGREEGGEEGILLLGKTYEALGDNNYATTVYEEYVNEHPESVLVLNQLALSKMKAQDYKGALAAIEIAMKVENNEFMQTLKFNEIVCYEYLQDFKKAAVLMESYLNNYPDDEAAKREYEFLKTR